MIAMTTPALRLVALVNRKDDPDHCRHMATKHRDKHLALVEMAKATTDRDLHWVYHDAAERALRLAEQWEARANAIEGDRNG